ncbi:MAG: hypothetical protein BM565_08285 [Gammaproteobacteria bacterium MedPE]|nr:MAG: hypothetical protein BM565_08285 [Gammaproteobacteria bacterium MedPE]
MLSLNTNTSYLFQQRQLGKSNAALATTFSRLSSGLRINSAKDDAAGLQISNRLSSQVNGLNVAVRNANDGISIAQTAEGALKETTNILFRMRDLSLQAANGSLSAVDREALNKESEQLKSELNRINTTTSFGGNEIFDTKSTDSIVNTSERNIIEALRGGLLAESEDIIFDQLGLLGSGATLKIDLENIDGSGGTLASVSYIPPNGNNLVMTIDLDDFETLDQSSIDRFNSTILHEMTHAIMADTMNLSANPTWFVEGTAEAISGADDRVASDIANFGVAAIKSNLQGIFTNDSVSPSTGIEVAGVYSGGYITMRYLEDKIGGAGIKSMMNELSSGQTFDQALNTASGGSYTTIGDLQTELFGGTVFEDFVNSMNLTNADNGAFGGLDASGGPTRAQTITGSSNASTTSNFVTTFISGDDDSVSGDFASNVNYAGAGLTEVALEDYSALTNSEGSKLTKFQIGADANQTIDMSIGGFSTKNLGLADFDIANNPQGGISAIDDALSYVDSQRAGLGAFINRMEHTINNLQNIGENVSASRARIRDTDYATETAELTRNQILQQATTAMMAQSKQQPQLVLQLLG